MTRAFRRYRRIAIFLIGALAVALIVILRTGLQKEKIYPKVNVSAITQQLGEYGKKSMPGQQSYLQMRNDSLATFKPAKETVMIQAADKTAVSHDSEAVIRRDEIKNTKVLDWKNGQGWIEWAVDVPQEGAYELTIDYKPLKGSYAGVVRGIQIDGVFPFREAEHLTFERWWKDAQYPYDRNGIGNEIRPVQTEIEGWRKVTAANYALSSEPLLWPLTKGRHTVRMVGGREPLSLASLTFHAPEPIPAYAGYVTMNPGQDQAGRQDWFHIAEAEQYFRKSAIGIQTQSVSEPYASPDPRGRVVYNAIGGERWQDAGDWIEWQFEVPETGMYELDLKYFQGYNGEAGVYRTIMIDERVPFREMLHYRMAPNHALEIRTLSDDGGKPYLFHLEKGEHRLRLIADASVVEPAVLALQERLSDLRALDREIRIISGNYGFGDEQNLDTGRTWEMTKYDPEIAAKLRRISDGMQQIRQFVDGLNQHGTGPTVAIASAVATLNKLLADINDIPNKVKQLSDIHTSVNNWLKPLESQGMQLDYIVVRKPKAETGLKSPDGWDRIRYSTANFMRTFFQNYDLKEINNDKAITVWVQRGRDYVDLLQKMIEQDFTPKTGIQVNVNLMPNTNALIMSNAAGNQPDIALGMGMELPVDYAMRGAAADLSKFPGFEEVKKRFNPGVMRSYQYNSGTYALPETQMFMALFYRTDVLELLGLKPPETWDDVAKMLPTLRENGMMFYYPTKEFVMPFYQHGAEFYTRNGMQAKLNDDPSLEAFKQWNDLFLVYDLPKEVPAFFNHFRFGDMPIGIADFNTYLQLTAAAPEISGHWKMAPLPGLKNPAGEIVRWSQQATTAAMMMKKSKKQEQAWKFLDWWTSTDIQARFANDIESFAGIEYRWNTANVDAMKQLPWPDNDVAVLAEQSRWAKNMPIVPGYYLLAREMDFAWNATVLGGVAPKEALDKSAVSLQREMTRKQTELGLTSKTNLNISPYDLPFDSSGVVEKKGAQP